MNTINKYLTICFIVLLMCGCNDFLDIDTPKDQLDSDKVFLHDNTAEAALANIYASVRNTGFLSGYLSGMGVLLGCYSDELEATTAKAVEHRYFYEGIISSNNNAVNYLWSQTYKQIYAINNLIEGVEKSTGITSEMKKKLVGEALVLRGILHFYMTQTYGSVPYITGTDYNDNKKIAKIAVNQVMEKVEDDLVRAETLLPQQYPTNERVRINQAVAQAFLARIYLYQEKWEMAAQYADKLILNSDYKLEDPEMLFLKESKSAIWQFKPANTGGNAPEADTYIFNAVPAPEIQLSEFLLNSFETGDKRKEKWVKFIGDDKQACAFKYKQKGFTASSLEYSIIIRLEEMYLIAAEAAAESNDWQGCATLLNTIRSRAGLPEITISGETNWTEAVLKERRVELFCEFGHRFYDLKRRKRWDLIRDAKPNWKMYSEVLPLPENELSLNPNLLPQNPGY